MIVSIPWLPVIGINLIIAILSFVFVESDCKLVNALSPQWSCGTPFEGLLNILWNDPTPLDLILAVDDLILTVWGMFLMNYDILRSDIELLNILGWGVRLFFIGLGGVMLASVAFQLFTAARNLLPL